MLKTLWFFVGLGGWYRYRILHRVDDNIVQILGPFRSRRLAAGPTAGLRLSTETILVRFHWCPPQGALVPEMEAQIE